ncbi:hypothetical protein TNCV_1302551 [Trichonephila clavipes]|nr:hypothetical protein TNCV_1302551 [Trichonephila clavipes]
MLIQPASSQLGLVRGIVVLLKNAVTELITEQHKRMEVINQQLCEAPTRGDIRSTLSTRPVSVGKNEEPLKSFILKSVY